jgi:hypothetical protein
MIKPITILTTLFLSSATFAEQGTLTVRVTENGQPEAARVRLRDASKEPVIPEGVYKYRDSFICDGEGVIDATPGHYTLDVLKGTEYKRFTRPVEIKSGESLEIEAPMERWIDMNERGWYSGDLHVHRPALIVPALMKAEEINLCEVQTVWNQNNYWAERALPEEPVQKIDDNHVYNLYSEEDERDGGAVMFYGLKKLIDVSKTTRVYPTSLDFIEQAHEQGGWVEQEKPFWWESPVNVAVGKARSTELANNHFCEEFLLDNEAWGRPRDKEKYPDLLGYALNVFDIYYHYLNAGFPLIATAGSASGVLPNPVGYNRVYVDCGDEFSYERWWERLGEGRNFVTNGPMLFVTVDGRGPGGRLSEEVQEVELKVETFVATSIDRIEVVVDGAVVAEHVPVGESSEVEWETSLDLKEAAWVAVRCFEPAEDTIRFAHSGPIRIQGRVSHRKKEAGQFFLAWMDELLARIEAPDRYDSVEQKEEIRKQYLEAREVYEKIAAN